VFGVAPVPDLGGAELLLAQSPEIHVPVYLWWCPSSIAVF
jgi:hypothetical protein